MKEFRLSIPSTLRDVKLRDWQRFQDVYDKNKDNDNQDFLNLKMIQIFCGVELNDIKNIPLSSFDEILEHLNEVFGQKTDRVNSFKLIGTDDVEVEFGLIPNLDEMTYGEFTDLETYIYDRKTAHKAMAVLYRPIQFKKKDSYHIQRYKGSEHLSDIMKDAPLDVYLGVQVFFYNLAKKLGIYTMDSTLQQLAMNVGEESEMHLGKNGEDIKQSINLQRETLQSLMKLQKLTSISH
tara:strand:- start:442 stop:1149 length:708 start_codon:yes stop_codon:yes gene_type:complete